MAERVFIESIKCLVASVVVIVSLAGAWATSAQAQGKSSPIKIRLATPSASLSYLPIRWRCNGASSPGAVSILK